MPVDLQATDLNPAWLERVRARPTGAGNTPQVLLVEPDRNVRELLKLHLVTAGYCVKAAEDASVIAAELARRPTDLVILDMGLPSIDGVEFFVAEPEGELIPVLFLTADESTRERVERLGALACLTRPIYADIFLDAVARALRARDTARVRAGLRPPSAGPRASASAA